MDGLMLPTVTSKASSYVSDKNYSVQNSVRSYDTAMQKHLTQQASTRTQTSPENSICSNNAATLTAVDRRLGEYCNSLETRSTASAGILLWKILCHG